jgi:hypothetical protein
LGSVAAAGLNGAPVLLLLARISGLAAWLFVTLSPFTVSAFAIH